MWERQELPPLADVIALGDSEAVAQLIRDGADIKPQEAGAYPLLHWMIDLVLEGREDALRIAELHVDAGSDIEQRGVNDWTPLHLAANCGHLQFVQMLVERGADVNVRTRVDHYETPLMKAALRGRTDVIKYLLEIGADPTPKDLVGKTAAEIVSRKRHPEAFQVLQAEAGSRRTTRRGRPKRR